MGDDLVEFLLACFAEDEDTARDAAHYLALYGRPDDERWVVRQDESCSHDTGTGVWVLDSGRGGGRSSVVGDIDGRRTAEHIARFDPARILAECDAKRRIVEDIARAAGEVWGYDLALVLRLLALPYADHPDYRPEWDPSVTSSLSARTETGRPRPASAG